MAMDASCYQLSMEGERLLRAHDYEGAIEFFEAGLRVGTDDKQVLSATYNQLGNCCFYVGKFHKALEYHKKDLEIAEQLKDKQGMAKAYGNLGNTFKALKNFSNAIKCCESHLELTRALNDKLGEGRACYNLGNVYHAIGKGKLSKKDATVGKVSNIHFCRNKRRDAKQCCKLLSIIRRHWELLSSFATLQVWRLLIEC